MLASGRIARALCAPLIAAALASACGPRLVREPIVEGEAFRVELRHRVDGGEVVPQGFDHPVTISDVRVGHILANLAYAPSDAAEAPVIRAEHLYELAQALSLAYARAGPDDEIVAAAFSRDRRLSIFTVDRATAFRSYVRGDALVFEFFALEERVERSEGRASSAFEIPAELPTSAPGFRLMPGEAQERRGPRALAVVWRDPYYGQPVSLRARFGGRGRRTTLLEAPDALEPEVDVPATSELSDAQIRALDTLHAARRAGYVTEAEFRRRLRLILADDLEAAGYPRTP